MKKFLETITAKAQKNPRKIVFPEGFEPRILKAISILQKEKTCIPIMLGKKDDIANLAKKHRINVNFKILKIIDPENSPYTEKYIKAFYKLRKHKGITEEQSREILKKVNYFGTMMVKMGDADGMISGSNGSTADSVRPALQLIKTQKKFHKVSGFFFMMLKKRLLLFADCSIAIEPNSYELADTAIDTAETAKRFGIKPRVALLSFSTNHSGDHPNVDKVREAVEIVRYRRPDLIVEGEMQVDAALVPEVCARKFPKSRIKGDANVLIFPSLEAANIAYKLVERLGGFTAIGPILQGLKKPVNDLSRGCKVSDIVTMAAITSVEAQQKNFT